MSVQYLYHILSVLSTSTGIYVTLEYEYLHTVQVCTSRLRVLDYLYRLYEYSYCTCIVRYDPVVIQVVKYK